MQEKKRTLRRTFRWREADVAAPTELGSRPGRNSVSRNCFRICDNKRVCNRYRLTRSKQYIADRFHATADEIQDRQRYNIAPTQQVLTVRKEQGKTVRHFTTMRWGLIPSWAKDMSIGTRTLNARSETVATTPAFRDSILTKRCLIPADGFYEWRLFIMNDSCHYSVSRTIAE
jgi:putative SOS response-associated peptidase YedK